MSREYNVAIAGATGAVGVEMIKTLEQRDFPVKSLKLLAEIHPVQSGSVFYAAIAGVFLFLAGVATGWIDNMAVYTRLAQRVCQSDLLSVLGNRPCRRPTE